MADDGALQVFTEESLDIRFVGNLEGGLAAGDDGVYQEHSSDRFAEISLDRRPSLVCR